MKEQNATMLAGLVNFPITIAGEAMQVATCNGTMDYNFAVGHVSDFGLAGLGTALGLLVTQGTSRATRFLGATLPAALLTAHEYFPVIQSESIVDHWDTACYWIAAGVVTGVVKYLSDDSFRYKVNSAIQKINPFKKTSSSLDDLIDQPRN